MNILKHFICIATLLIAFLYLAGLYAPSDFKSYYDGAKAVVNGINPYGSEFVSELSLGNRDITIRIWGSPFSIAPFLPFALFSFDFASKVFDALLIISIYLAFASLLKANSRNNYLFAVLLFPIGLLNCALYWQSPSWIILSALTITLLLIRQQSYFLAGMSLSIFWLKPHLAAILSLPVLIFCIKNRKYSFLLGIGAATALMAFILTAFRPGIFTDYLLSLKEQAPFNFANMSIPSQVNAIFNFNYPLILFLPGLFISGFLAFFYKYKSLDRLIVLIMPISLTFAPYSWLHDYLLIIPFLSLFIVAHIDSVKGRLLTILIMLSALIEKYFGFNAEINFTTLFALYGGILSLVAIVLLSEEQEQF